MKVCKICGKQFGSSNPKVELCNTCEKALERVKGYAKPVVHGEWIKLDECDYQCSECGFRFTSADPISKFEYCRCGAKMDRGEL